VISWTAKLVPGSGRDTMRTTRNNGRYNIVNDNH